MSFNLLTESSDALLTESGVYLVTEDATHDPPSGNINTPTQVNDAIANVGAIQGLSEFHREIIRTVLIAQWAGVAIDAAGINALLVKAAPLQMCSQQKLCELRTQFLSNLL